MKYEVIPFGNLTLYNISLVNEEYEIFQSQNLVTVSCFFTANFDIARYSTIISGLPNIISIAPGTMWISTENTPVGLVLYNENGTINTAIDLTSGKNYLINVTGIKL